MLANDITLAVDLLNTGVTTDEVFSCHERHLNRSVYIGEEHSPASRDNLGFYRTFPKTSGNFKGTCKSALKFTKDFEVEGVDSTTTVTAPAIMEVSFSLPVGLTEAQMLVIRQRAIALLDDDTVMDDLNRLQMV
jgi:hypothetical protein